MPVQGTPDFDAIAVLDIDAISFVGPTAGTGLVAHAAFVNTKNGNTYGETEGRIWSKETWDKLAELRASMERDIALRVFVQATSSGRPAMTKEPTGLGEQARQQHDAEQV